MTSDQHSSRTVDRFAEAGLRVAAPLWLVGWAVMRLGGRRGPGPLWSLAHSVWIVAFLLLGGACLALFRRADRRGRAGTVASVALGAALAGTAALVGQMTCDLVVGLRSADKAAMSDTYDRVFAVPGVELALFQVGPPLLFMALLGLVVLARRHGRATVPTVVLAVVGVLVMVAGKPLPGWWRALEGIGAACLGLALAQVARHSPADGDGRAGADEPRPTAPAAHLPGA